MKNALQLIFFLVSFFSKAQTSTFQWAKSLGGNSFEEGYAITVDAYGGVYTTGYFQGTADFDPGPGVFNLSAVGLGGGGFVSKLDVNGNFIWAKNIDVINGGLQNNSIAVDAFGNAYLMGFFYGVIDFDPGPTLFTINSTNPLVQDIYILKLDALGNFEWAKNMGGGSNNNGMSIKIDALGNAYGVGYFGGTSDFDPGVGVFNLTSTPSQYNGFILKLDSFGNFVWAKNIGGAGLVELFSIAFDASANIYTTGCFGGTIDFDPGIGTFSLTVAQASVFISKLDANGNFFWAKKLEGPNGVYGMSIDVDATGNAYTTGRYYSSADFDPGLGTYILNASNGTYEIFISKLDANGNFVWASNVVETSIYGMASIACQTTGDVYISATYNGLVDFDPGPATYSLTSVGGDDAFISKFDASGNFIWANSMGGGMVDRAFSIAVDGIGNIYTTGMYEGVGDFDPGAGIFNLNCVGNRDVFVSKLGQGTLTGIKNNFILNNISIYPNPTDGVLNVELGSENFDELSEKKIKFEISDLIGNVIIDEKSVTQSSSINLKYLKSGIYFVKISLGNFSQTFKFIKEY